MQMLMRQNPEEKIPCNNDMLTFPLTCKTPSWLALALTKL